MERLLCAALYTARDAGAQHAAQARAAAVRGGRARGELLLGLYEPGTRIATSYENLVEDYLAERLPRF